MNILDSFYHLVRAYPGGAVSLAPRLGKSASSLSHEVRPPEGGTAKLGLQTAVDMMALTGDHTPLHAINAELGYMAIPLPVVSDDASDDAQAAGQRLADVAREFADVMGAASLAIADGRVTDNELKNVEQQFGELVAQGQALLGLFARLNAAQKRGL